MFRPIGDWLAARKQRKAARYADQIQHMDRAELQRLREQQSPTRSSRGSRR